MPLEKQTISKTVPRCTGRIFPIHAALYPRLIPFSERVTCALVLSERLKGTSVSPLLTLRPLVQLMDLLRTVELRGSWKPTTHLWLPLTNIDGFWWWFLMVFCFARTISIRTQFIFFILSISWSIQNSIASVCWQKRRLIDNVIFCKNSCICFHYFFP